MKNSQSSKLLVTFGKKPRKSKTSIRYEYERVKYFLYSNKTSTNENYHVFEDNPPYPLVAVIGMARDETVDKVLDWIRVHSSDIKTLLGDYRDRVQIPLDSWELIQKNRKKLDRRYKILDKQEEGYALAVCNETRDTYKYLYVKLSEAPTKGSGAKKRPDSEEIYKEYLRRLEDERIQGLEEISRE